MLALGVATALTGTAFANTDTAQDPKTEGRVTLSGKIIPETCEVSTDSKELNVKLPTLSVLSLKGQDKGKTPFTIKLVNCVGGHSAISLGFKPAAGTVTAEGYLSNTLTENAAKNVAILLTSGTNPVLLHKPVGEQNVEELPEAQDKLQKMVTEWGVDGTFEYGFKFFAEYAPTGEVAAGNVGATLPFSIIYK